MNSNLQRKLNMAFVAMALIVTFVVFQNFTNLQNQTAMGSDNSVNVAAGQIMGGCTYQYNSAFAVISAPNADKVIWPMVSCDSQGNYSCAAGFGPLSEAPTQMNGSGTPNTAVDHVYWGSIKCVSLNDSKLASDFVRGQAYGGCLRPLGSDFKPNQLPQAVYWPMKTCNLTEATCEAGFAAVNDTPVQMNCSATPSKTSFSPCYWLSTKCVKL